MTQYLYGMHDREGRHIVPPGGWCLDTVALSENPPPTDYAALRSDVNWIVRLNNAYGSGGTIPPPDQYQAFAASCAAYVARSNGANIYIVGNEPNHENERPNGVYITPGQYARCFAMCRDAIKRANINAQVIPAPCAPYHANPVSWLDYWREMLTLIAADGGCDGIAIHAYTRSSNPDDIISNAKMGTPLEGTYSGFLTYQDALDAVPMRLGNPPAYITEFNELLEGGWDDRNTGVVQEAYAEINAHNQNDDPSHIFIRALILYRWPKYDKWYIDGKQGVIDDFNAAVAKGYTSPPTDAQGQGEPMNTFLPSVSTGNATPALPPREFDPRLTERGVSIETPPLKPGEKYWRIKSARWYDEHESQGRHHIYVEALDEKGRSRAGLPFAVKWPTGRVDLDTNGRGGFDAGNFPMSKSLNEFNVAMTGGGYPSETLRGIGMGANGNSGIHTSTGVVYELATVPQESAPPFDTHLPFVPNGKPTAVVNVPAGANIRSGPGMQYPIVGREQSGARLPITGRTADGDWWQVLTGWVSNSVVEVFDADSETEPPSEPEQPTGDCWERAIAFVRKWEGGWADNPADPGGATNKGITIGTYARWREVHGQPSPTKDDLHNLSDAEADEIYRDWYWRESGADKLSFPLCLAHFDTAVNAGPARAKEMLSKSNGDFLAYMGHLLTWYTKIDGFETFGRAWTRRRADLLIEASK